MPYVGVLLALKRRDPVNFPQDLPPVFGLDCTPLSAAKPHPTEADLRIGALEHSCEDWQPELFMRTLAAAPLQGIDATHLYWDRRWMGATVHFDVADGRFQVTASFSLVERKGFIPALIQAFQLPNDPEMVYVGVGPDFLTPGKTATLLCDYDWETDSIAFLLGTKNEPGESVAGEPTGDEVNQV